MPQHISLNPPPPYTGECQATACYKTPTRHVTTKGLVIPGHQYNICFRLLLLSEQLLYGKACSDDQGRDAQLQSHHLRSSPLVGLGTIQSALQFYPTSPSRMGLLPFGHTISGPTGTIRFKLLMKMYPVGVAGTFMYLISMSVIWWRSA